MTAAVNNDNFFDGPFFDGPFFDAGTPTGPQPDNTVGGTSAARGRQYVERLSKREEWLERLRLGIVFEQIEEGEAAVGVAARAQERATRAPEGGDEIAAAHQSEVAAREAYFAVYREYMEAEAIIAQWRHDVAEHRKRIRNAAAALLLLH